MNNCVGCFNRNPILLNKMAKLHPEKMQWFADQERVSENGKKRTFRDDVTYEQVIRWNPIEEFDFEDFGPCDSGGCGI